MTRIRDQRLASQSEGPILIGANEVLRVPTGLIIDGESVNPHFVDIASDCPFLQILETSEEGWFEIWNPTLVEVAFSWKAHHLHSEESEPIPTVEDSSDPSPDPAPASVCTLPPGAIELSFLDLTDTPASYAGSAGFGVRVNVGEDGLEFFDLASVIEGIKYSWPDAAGRAAQTGMVDGELGVQRDTGDVYKYDDPPGAWSVFFNLQDGFFATATRGDILRRGAVGWEAYSPGALGDVLTSQGALSDPVWQAPTSGGKNLAPTLVVGNAQNGDTLSDCDYLHDNGTGVPPYNDGLQEAINNLPALGGVIYVRPGVYDLQTVGGYVIPEGCSIIGEGEGVTIFSLSTTPPILFNAPSRSNVNLENFTIRPPVGWNCINVIYFLDCKQSSIKNVEIESAAGVSASTGVIRIRSTGPSSSIGIHLYNVRANVSGQITGNIFEIVGDSLTEQIENVIIEKCETYNLATYRGINFQYAVNCKVLKGKHKTPINLATGICNAIKVSDGCYDIEINDCRFVGTRILIDISPNDINNGDNLGYIKVINNHFIPYAIAIYATNKLSDPLTTEVFGLQIQGNTFESPPDGDIPDKAMDAIVKTLVAHSCDISHNFFYMNGRSGGPVNIMHAISTWNYFGPTQIIGNMIENNGAAWNFRAIECDVSKDVAVIDNKIKMLTTSGYNLIGIICNWGGEKTRICDNSIDIRAFDDGGQSACIDLGQSDYVNAPLLCEDNHCYMDQQEAAGTGYGIWFVLPSGGVQNASGWNITGNGIEVVGNGTLFCIEANLILPTPQLGQAITNVLKTNGTHIGPNATAQLVTANNLLLV